MHTQKNYEAGGDLISKRGKAALSSLSPLCLVKEEVFIYPVSMSFDPHISAYPIMVANRQG